MRKTTEKQFITMADLPPDPLDKAALEEYRALGFSACILTEDRALFTKGGTLTQDYRAAIRNIRESGMSVFIRNMYNDADYFCNPADKQGSNYGSPYAIEKRNVTSELGKVGGFYMADEAYMRTQSDSAWRWAHRDRAQFASFEKLEKLTLWKNEYYPEAYFHVNHVPSSSFDHYFPSGCEIVDYEDFLRSYVETVLKKLKGGGRSLCLDNYPFVREKVIGPDYLDDLLTGATLTKQYNETADEKNQADFGICVQTFSAHHTDGSGWYRDIYSDSEITFQLFCGMALGATLFEYFCYRSLEQEGLHGILRADGSHRLYDLVKRANARALPFEQTVCGFDFSGAFGSAGYERCDNAQAFIRAKRRLQKPKNISFSSSHDALVGCFESKDEYGYMIVNYTDPSLNQSNNVRLAGAFDAVELVGEGGKKEKKAASGIFETTLPAGSAVFVSYKK